MGQLVDSCFLLLKKSTRSKKNSGRLPWWWCPHVACSRGCKSSQFSYSTCRNRGAVQCTSWHNSEDGRQPLHHSRSLPRNDVPWLWCWWLPNWKIYSRKNVKEWHQLHCENGTRWYFTTFVQPAKQLLRNLFVSREKLLYFMKTSGERQTLKTIMWGTTWCWSTTLCNPVRNFRVVKDTAYSSLVLFQATFVTCFLPVVCWSLSCFFVFVLFYWKQEDFLANSLIFNKIFAFCTVASTWTYW